MPSRGFESLRWFEAVTRRATARSVPACERWRHPRWPRCDARKITKWCHRRIGPTPISTATAIVACGERSMGDRTDAAYATRHTMQTTTTSSHYSRLQMSLWNQVSHKTNLLMNQQTIQLIHSTSQPSAAQDSKLSTRSSAAMKWRSQS